MKAIVVHEAGGPEKLVHEQVPDPTAGQGEVVVEVEAAGLNFIDTYQRGGLYEMDFPFTPGLEGAGTVIEVGDGVTELASGDRVGWTGAIGSYASRNVVAAERLIPVPDGITTNKAAAVLLQGVTAHYLACDTFPLEEGHTCLVHAGAGGVGLLLTQIAKQRGARVITTVGTEEKAGLSRDAGADEVVVYSDVDFKEAVEELVGPHNIDVVFDGVGAATFNKSVDLLRPRGMMVTFGNASGPVPPISPLLLAQKGSIFLTRPTTAHYTQTRDDLVARTNDLFGWIESGDLEIRIGADYPLEQAEDAHRALEGRQTTGKVLLHP